MIHCYYTFSFQLRTCHADLVAASRLVQYCLLMTKFVIITKLSKSEELFQ